MGKASSSKKVARAARAGGRVSTGQPRGLLFPSVLTLIVVLGLTLVVYARNERNQEDTGGPPQLSDHFHQAFGVNICGEWKVDMPVFDSKIGVHTHGDGVLHVHPHSALGAGSNATLGTFLKEARDNGLFKAEISNSRLEYGGSTAVEGKTKCEGVKDPVLRMAYWKNVQDAASLPLVTTGDFNGRRLSDDGGGITLFYGDPDADIPKPLAAPNLASLGAADQDPSATTTTAPEGETTTTAEGETTTTAPGETTTTVEGETTTTAPGEPTTTVPAGGTTTTATP